MNCRRKLSNCATAPTMTHWRMSQPVGASPGPRFTTRTTPCMLACGVLTGRWPETSLPALSRSPKTPLIELGISSKSLQMGSATGKGRRRLRPWQPRAYSGAIGVDEPLRHSDGTPGISDRNRAQSGRHDRTQFPPRHDDLRRISELPVGKAFDTQHFSGIGGPPGSTLGGLPAQ